MNMCDAVAQRATCDRRHVGAIATRNNRILATGYNGSSPGAPHCSDPEIFWECPNCGKKHTSKRTVCTWCTEHPRLIKKQGGHEMHDNHCIRVVHAEVNVVAQAARDGIALQGSTLWCNTKPCYNCFKTIVSAGVQEVVWRDEYGVLDPRVERLACEIGFKFRQFKPSKT